MGDGADDDIPIGYNAAELPIFLHKDIADLLIAHGMLTVSEYAPNSPAQAEFKQLAKAVYRLATR